QVEEALAHGLTCVQLREKHLDYDSFLKEAKEIQGLCQRYTIPFIINDNVELALACGADGLHIGQEDGSVAAIRERIGKDMILGVSAQTLEQALAAEKEGADYLGVGAVFPTSSKADAIHVSLDTLAEICQTVSIPVVAIGGISLDNIGALKGKGLAGVSLISAILGAPSIGQATEELRKESEEL
ncbi:MAG: thiamine phosphate synthase, partial [Veillonella sp.]|nr:thiamine phosphate synthase [Veillonella sp.]